MRIHINNQNDVYKLYWLPMQQSLGDDLTEFIRHYLMMSGNIIKQSDIYYSLKEQVSPDNAIEYLEKLKKYSTYYDKIKNPEKENNEYIKRGLKRLNRIEVTTAYPLLLNFYNDYFNQTISDNDFSQLLNIIENYLIRRFVCNIPSNQLNKIFPIIYSILKEKYPNSIVVGLKNILQDKGYPKDNEFLSRFRDIAFYGGGDRAIKAKLILESLEESFSHKEKIDFDNLTIEHVMPQTLSEWWQEYLGDEWGETHDIYLHTIGNLTLTAYNSELSNDIYPRKQATLKDSHLELNKYFSSVEKWSREEIEKRSSLLADKALHIWPYFGQDNYSSSNEVIHVTGTTPISLYILGQYFPVKNWRDVLENTLNVIADLEPQKFSTISDYFSSKIGKDKSKFRAIRQLKNGYYFEVNLSAQSIQKLCYQAIEMIELTDNDWEVEIQS